MEIYLSTAYIGGFYSDPTEISFLFIFFQLLWTNQET